MLNSVKHSRGNVIMWGCLSPVKLRDSYRVQGMMNMNGYHK